ncbi:MAG: glutamine--fructose-6-phosphate transaminase (isomerizing) [Candidatus Nanohaloarchaea archaeon]
MLEINATDMCGIVGVKKEGEASEKAFESLKRLEYRGYDSAGIATADSSIEVVKGTGTIDEAVNKESFGESAIGHTRWATHGGVNEVNAHPHTDCNGSIAVAHNGIINNYKELKSSLSGVGHRFESETDTEVIPHLIEEYFEGGASRREACERVMEDLEGSFAVTVLFESGDIVAFRKSSPLVIGVGEGEHFVASDFTAFLEHTERALFLEDGDLAVLNSNLEVYSDGEKVDREVKEIDWDSGDATKAGHDHYMTKEIREQKNTIKRAAFQDRSDMREAVSMLDDADNIYMTACGTASYAAEIGAKYLREAGYEPHVEKAHELEHRADKISGDDIVVAVSQSGETADLLSVLEETDADVLSVVNVVGSTLARNSEKALYVNAGPEIAVASTKAFTAQITVLKLLAHSASDKLDRGRKELIETAEKVSDVLKSNQQTIESVAGYLKDKQDVYFIGRNLGRELAYESALKLKELSYLHAEGFPGGEFKHGTLALIEEGIPVFCFLNHDRSDLISNAMEAESRGADLIGVGDEPTEDLKYFFKIPEDPNSEILEIVPMQMLAYRTAVKRGNDPDKPRNLAKSVTVK